jgi:hypothetical protein
MIYIDLPADLNLEDDGGRNVARLADAASPDTVTRGAVLVAGTPHAWSWAVIEDVDGGFVYFRQISARDAGLGRAMSMGVDVLQTGTRDPVERVGVLGEPFGFVARVREDEAVLHGDVGVDLGQAGDDVFRRLAGDFTP